MTFVITQHCCNDAACVPVCPVNCIHPTPNEPGYATAEMLYIDPATCIDCGACLDVCPVGAISADYDLAERDLPFVNLNALFYRDAERAVYEPSQAPPTASPAWAGPQSTLRVAIVGSGPAGCYAAEELMSRRGLQVGVDMFERLPTPWGLVRFGVAPDHAETKAVAATFERISRRSGFRLFLDVDVGRDLLHEDLASRYDAVLYAAGAMADRSMGIPGEDLPGSHSATELVGWYNGHPDFAGRVFDLSGGRAVVIGNGNVAIDVARILLGDLEALRRTDIADHALAQLAQSGIREVEIVGRRGPQEAAFTTPELLGLMALPGLTVRALREDLDAAQIEDAHRVGVDVLDQYKADLVERLVEVPRGERTITLRFCASPAEVLGADRVAGVRLVRNRLERDGSRTVAVPTREESDVPCGLLVRSVGFRGMPMADLPFDHVHGVLPNVKGRLTSEVGGAVVPGVYVTGWIKRGPSGVIGSNKSCAKETVSALLEDFTAGRLGPGGLDGDVADLLPAALGVKAWRAIDTYEVQQGRAASRPRVKVVDRAELLRIASADVAP